MNWLEYCDSRGISLETWRKIAAMARVPDSSPNLSAEDVFDLDWMLEESGRAIRTDGGVRGCVLSGKVGFHRSRLWKRPRMMACSMGRLGELLVEVWGMCEQDGESCYIVRLPRLRKVLALAVGDPGDWRTARPSESVL